MSAGHADEIPWGLFWQAQPSHWIELGKTLYGEEVGKPATDADLLVAYADVNQDTIGDILVYPINPALCGEPICSPRLYTFIDSKYHERIAVASSETKVLPADIDVSSIRRGGYLDLTFGINSLYWLNGAYVSWSSIVPSVVDDTAFIKACSGTSNFLEDPNNANPSDPAAGAQELCGCIAYQLALRQQTQAELDAIAADIDGGTIETSLWSSYSESLRACRTLQTWDPWPRPDEFPVRRNDVRAFYNTCARQEWVIQSYRIGSPHRAMAFCGCFAEGVATQDFSQDSVDLLKQLYADELTDTDVSDKDPELVAKTDTIAEECINDLRHADYVNGVTRPGSPNPNPD